MGTSLGPSKKQGRRSHRPTSEIKVTTFIDVMLVLLVVFMVAAPLLTVGVPVDLPKTDASVIQEIDDAPVEVTVSNDGKVFVGKTEVNIAQMKAMLMAMAQTNPDRRVYVKGDQTLPYGTVMKVMAAINTSGFNRVALISDPAGE